MHYACKPETVSDIGCDEHSLENRQGRHGESRTRAETRKRKMIWMPVQTHDSQNVTREENQAEPAQWVPRGGCLVPIERPSISKPSANLPAVHRSLRLRDQGEAADSLSAGCARCAIVRGASSPRRSTGRRRAGPLETNTTNLEGEPSCHG
jgi:hypothetical protein